MLRTRFGQLGGQWCRSWKQETEKEEQEWNSPWTCLSFLIEIYLIYNIIVVSVVQCNKLIFACIAK